MSGRDKIWDSGSKPRMDPHCYNFKAEVINYAKFQLVASCLNDMEFWNCVIQYNIFQFSYFIYCKLYIVAFR